MRVFGLVLLLTTLYTMLTPLWWAGMLVGFAAGLAAGRGRWTTFFNAGFASGLVWLAYAFWLSNRNENILLVKMTALIGAPHYLLLYFATALIAAMLTAPMAVAGYFTRKLIEPTYRF